jgi:hypothetical protein
MAVANELGTLEEGDAAARLLLAETVEAAGEHEQAREAIALARDHLLARAARFSDSNWRDSFLANIPEHARTLQLAAEWLGDR